MASTFDYVMASIVCWIFIDAFARGVFFAFSRRRWLRVIAFALFTFAAVSVLIHCIGKLIAS